MSRAQQADNWPHFKGDPESPLVEEFERGIRKRHYPDEHDWKELG